MLVRPVLVKLIFPECVFCIFKNLIYCYNALGNKVDALDFGNRRNVAALKIKSCFERLSEIFGGNLRCCAAANNVFALF